MVGLEPTTRLLWAAVRVRPAPPRSRTRGSLSPAKTPRNDEGFRVQWRISRPLSLAAKTCSWRGIENGADSGINPAGREQFEAPKVEAGRSGQWPRWWG